MVVQKLKTPILLNTAFGSLLAILVFPAASLAAGAPANLKTNPIISGVVQPIVNFLSALVGIVIIANIIIGGIQYSMAGGNAQEITKAKQRIINAFISFLVFIFAFAIVQYLVPGGIF